MSSSLSGENLSAVLVRERFAGGPSWAPSWLRFDIRFSDKMVGTEGYRAEILGNLGH